MAFEDRAHLLSLVDLRGTVDCVTDAFPDGREAPPERGSHPADAVVDSIVGVIEKRRDLVNAEEGIGVEDEPNKELVSGEFRIVEQRCECVSRGMAAVSTSNTRRVHGGLDGALVTVGTRSLLPGILQSPLDEAIERLGAKLYSTERDELLKHPAERRLSGYNRLHSARCPNFIGGYSLHALTESDETR